MHSRPTGKCRCSYPKSDGSATKEKIRKSDSGGVRGAQPTDKQKKKKILSGGVGGGCPSGGSGGKCRERATGRVGLPTICTDWVSAGMPSVSATVPRLPGDCCEVSAALLPPAVRVLRCPHSRLRVSSSRFHPAHPPVSGSYRNGSRKRGKFQLSGAKWCIDTFRGEKVA